jgi:hypothetical protein
MRFLVTRKQKFQLMREVERDIRSLYLVYSEMWLDDMTEEDRAEQVSFMAGEAVHVALELYLPPWWRFWRRRKKCRPIPCPAFEPVELRIE